MKTDFQINNVHVLSLDKPIDFKSVQIQLISTYHGGKEISQEYHSEVSSGFILSSPHESKKIYFVGDSLYAPCIKEAIKKHNPDYIVVNGCQAMSPYGPILMGIDGIAQVHADAPNSKIIVVHMDAVPHASLTRRDIKKFIHDENLENIVFMPNDNETLLLE